MKKYMAQVKKNSLLLLIGQLIISQALISCQSMVTELSPSVLPSTDSKLVVACFISPQDTVIAAKVTETKTVVGSTGDVKADITNATVLLSDGIHTVNLVYNAGNGYYGISMGAFPISAGKTYTITVSSPDGRKVDATTTVPNLTVPISQTKLDSGIVINRRNISQREYTAKIIFQDQAGVKNYYRGIGVFYETIPIPTQPSQTFMTLTDFRSTDDTKNDGQLLSLQGTFRANYAVSQISRIQVMLLNVDVNYYNYQTSLQKQRDNNNPFAEPILLYTNINGGFGCFGSYNRSLQTIR